MYIQNIRNTKTYKISRIYIQARVIFRVFKILSDRDMFFLIVKRVTIYAA